MRIGLLFAEWYPLAIMHPSKVFGASSLCVSSGITLRHVHDAMTASMVLYKRAGAILARSRDFVPIIADLQALPFGPENREWHLEKRQTVIITHKKFRWVIFPLSCRKSKFLWKSLGCRVETCIRWGISELKFPGDWDSGERPSRGMISAQNDPKFTSVISRKKAKGAKKTRSQLRKVRNRR
jgi:hypothetical protein